MMERTITKSGGRQETVTRFRICSTDMESWIRQNQAEYTGAMVEGCLLNNFVLACNGGFAAVYEHYINEWTSDYLVEFEPGAAQTVWKRWCEFEKRSKS